MFIEIAYLLDFTAPFHPGTGIRAGLIDRTIIKDKDDYLYIPASTLKGVLREHCERLLRFYLSDDQESPASPHNAEAALIEFGRAPGLISRIFGSQLHPGGLYFGDARQTDRSYKELQTSVSTQVRIDRIWRTAVNEALYTSEFGISGLRFEGSIKGRLTCTPIASSTITSFGQLQPTYSLLLLLAGLLMIEQIGGNKSTGKGQCQYRITDLWLDRKRCPDRLWQSWIEQLDVLSAYPPAEKERQS